MEKAAGHDVYKQTWNEGDFPLFKKRKEKKNSIMEKLKSYTIALIIM